eukprot:2876919-Rhodomonas_salina.2
MDHSVEFYNRPSKFTPPEMDRFAAPAHCTCSRESAHVFSQTILYHLLALSLWCPPLPDSGTHHLWVSDVSFDKYNNMMMPRNCVGGGATSCCPQWASDEGLCPPEEVIPTPGHCCDLIGPRPYWQGVSTRGGSAYDAGWPGGEGWGAAF